MIFHWFSQCFANTQRKRKNPYVYNVFGPFTAPDRRAATCLDGRKRADRTHVAFGEAAGYATGMLKGAPNDFAAHT